MTIWSVFQNPVTYIVMCVYACVCMCACEHKCACVHVRIETRSGHLDQFFSESSGSDPVYKISSYDPDSALDHVY